MKQELSFSEKMAIISQQLQGEVTKSTKSFYGKYANIGDIRSSLDPLLNEYRLRLRYTCKFSNDCLYTIITCAILSIDSDEQEYCSMAFKTPTNEVAQVTVTSPKGVAKETHLVYEAFMDWGKWVTYVKRYLLLLVAGIDPVGEDIEIENKGSVPGSRSEVLF